MGSNMSVEAPERSIAKAALPTAGVGLGAEAGSSKILEYLGPNGLVPGCTAKGLTAACAALAALRADSSMGAVGALGAKAALLGGANGLACGAPLTRGPTGACSALAALGPETGACGALGALKVLCPAAGVGSAAGVGATAGLAPITGAPLPAGVLLNGVALPTGAPLNGVNGVALNAVPGRCGTASPSWGATWSWAAATRSTPPAA